MNKFKYRLYKYQTKDIECLLYHVRLDMSYGAGGSFGDGEKVFKGDMTKAKRAHDFLLSLLKGDTPCQP